MGRIEGKMGSVKKDIIFWVFLIFAGLAYPTIVIGGTIYMQTHFPAKKECK